MESLVYYAAWLMLKVLGALPRRVARAAAVFVVRVLSAMLPRLRRTANFNLRLAFPDWTDTQRKAVIRGMLRNLGWMAAGFAHLPRYTKENIDQIVMLD